MGDNAFLRRTLIPMALCAGALASPAVANAASTCDKSGTTLAIANDSIADYVLAVSGSDITLSTQAFDGTLTPFACTGSPTVNNIDTITYTEGGIGSLAVVEPDTFAPGATAEGSGDSEIEINATEPSGIFNGVELRDGDGTADRYVIGANGANVNPSETTDDADITSDSGFRVQGSPGADVVSAAGGEGTGGPETAEGVRLNGLAGNDQLTGGDDGDRLDGGSGDDALDGGPDDDSIDLSQSTGPVRIDLSTTAPQDTGLGRDSFANIENVTGTPQNDTLIGSSGDNSLNGGDGDDVLEGAGGDDSLGGGSGVDTASYASATSPVTVDLSLTGNSQNTGGAGSDYFSSSNDIESLRGGNGNDTLRGTDGTNRIDAGPGRDRILAAGGDDFVLARDGQADTVDCGAGSDTAFLDQLGVDSATACESSLFIATPVAPTAARPTCGGRPATIVAVAGKSTDGTEGRDVIVGTAGADRIDGRGGNDVICAGGGADRVAGGSGGDRVSGGAGDDSLGGGTGNDRLTGDSGKDTISGNAGRDVLSGASGNDRLAGGADRDKLYGGTGTDNLDGGASRDGIYGGPGNDRLIGGGGNDRLIGGPGRDRQRQ